MSRTYPMKPFSPNTAPHHLPACWWQCVLRTWGISQVRTPLELPGGAACWRIAPLDAPPLILAGDAFSPLGSRFDGCIQSGEDAAKELLATFGK
jgi:hypothetical protein